MNQEYYTVDDVARILQVHPKTIQRYIREGKLKATKIGKSWRLTGHDLSTFLEKSSSTLLQKDPAPITVHASAVVDIRDLGKEEAIRIMNALTASLNSKPVEFGQSSLQTQYIEAEEMIRVTLWGSPRFITFMMEAVSVLVGQEV